MVGGKKRDPKVARATPVEKARTALAEKGVLDKGVHLCPAFSFQMVDNTTEGEFGWHLLDEAGARKLLDFLRDISRSSWSQIRAQRGPNHRLHHDQDVSDIDAKAQERLGKYYAHMGGELFRFHVDDLPRLWGFVVDGTFFVVWWDPHHKVYAVP